MINKKNNLFIFAGIFLVLLLGFASAYVSSYAGYRYSGVGGINSFMQDSLRFDKSMCEDSDDFLLQIAPFGCEPAVVRSDLLAENDVPVFCQISATKINPLIDVEAIKTMTITGTHNGGVKGFAYHPSESALGLLPDGTLENPVLENLGYVVIILRKQPNESALENCVDSKTLGLNLGEVCIVEGNLTARIRYDVKNAFGVGRAEYYLPVMSEEDWKENYLAYGFWNGRGYLRADYVQGDEAKISIYSASEVAQGSFFTGNKEYGKLGFSSHIIKVGENSPEIFLPGFDPCRASLSLRLNSLEDPDTRARIRVNSETMEIAQGQDFLENRCTLTKIVKRGLYQSVDIRCREDDGNYDRFSLSVSPRIKITIQEKGGTEETKDSQIGDYLYTVQSNSGKQAKHIYLGYVGSTSESTDEEDLFAVLVSIPGNQKDMLDESELSYVSTYVKHRKAELNTGSDFWDVAGKGFNVASAGIVEAGNFIFSGEDFKIIQFKKNGIVQGDDYKDVNVQIMGFAEGSLYGDSGASLALSGEKEYSSAIEDFTLVHESYGNEESSKEEFNFYGEEALYESILLSYRTHNHEDLLDFCNSFRQNYPASVKNYDLTLYCDDKYFLSSVGIISHEVLVNKNLKIISFQGAIEPSYQEYGAEILVNGPKGSMTYRLPKDSRISLDYPRNGVLKEGEIPVAGKGEEYFSLVDLEEDYAQISIRFAKNIQDRSFDDEKVVIKFNEPYRVGAFEFILKEVNLQKVARVTVQPSFNNEFSNSTFPFKIGIEKRAIQLTPEKINKKIDNLDNQIENLQGKVDFLGKTVEWGNKACLATGAVLTIKNLWGNFKGGSIARSMIMRNPGGYNDICEKEVLEKKYKSIDQCFLDKSGEIDKKVDLYSEIIQEQNAKIAEYEKKATTTSEGGAIFEQPIIDKSIVAQEMLGGMYDYEDLVATLEKAEYLGEDGLFYPSKTKEGFKGEGINLNEINQALKLEHFEEGSLSIENIRDISLYQQILKESPDDPIAQKELYDLLFDVNVNTKQSQKLSGLASRFPGVDRNQLGYLEFGFDENNKPQRATYLGMTVNSVSSLNLAPKKTEDIQSFTGDTPVYMFRTNQDEEYLVVLNPEGGSKNMPIRRYDGDGNPSTTEDRYMYIYDTNGKLIEGGSEKYKSINGELEKFTFVEYDKASYQNNYLNPEVRYYEEAPYAGYPAVVPIEIDTGWYAATKPVLPVGSNIASYDKSGRVTSFWLCNVGQNGLENYISGDDICQMINLGTGQDYEMFYGLSKDETKRLVNKAVNYIELAQRAHTKGARNVRIDGRRFIVGSPQVQTPAVQCQEFMSPKDCSILFNACDPFICPSSRCNLGGTFPVRDVVQSGIIGSIALCYPNAKWHGGDVYVPVCVSGVYAGLDGWLQVKKAYRDCLQENLETGETVGICDEMQSIYMCDFFWRQALPVFQLVVPKLISAAMGQGTRGGGEYLSVQDAWQTAGDSIDYFKQYYANNVYTSFKLRSTEQIGSEVCKSFPSIIFPEGASLVDSLSQPYSPVQFHGKFSETQMTTATNPPLSHYKVTYLIYAGQDVGAYYRVYLRGESGSSYYQDATFNRYVASGYIPAGETISESVDKQWPSGYKQLCISVNGQEECGFQQVSTSFAVDYANDLYIKQQASQTNIRTENECVSGSTSLYSLLNPNLQAGAEGLIDPAIYNKGIIRVCATDNPGLGTDTNAGTQDARWVQVGYCGDKNIICWQDQNSVKDVIHSSKIENETLTASSQEALKKLFEQGDYWNNQQINEEFSRISGLTDKQQKVSDLTNLLNHVFWNKDKANVYLQRGKVYASMVNLCPHFCDSKGENLVHGFFDDKLKKCVIKDESSIVSTCNGLGCAPAGGENGNCKPPIPGSSCSDIFCEPDEVHPGGKGVLYYGILDIDKGECVKSDLVYALCDEGGCEPAGRNGACFNNPIAGSCSDVFCEPDETANGNGKGVIYYGILDRNTAECLKSDSQKRVCEFGCAPAGRNGICLKNPHSDVVQKTTDPDFESVKLVFKYNTVISPFVVCFAFADGYWRYKQDCGIWGNTEKWSIVSPSAGVSNYADDVIYKVSKQGDNYLEGLEILINEISIKGANDFRFGNLLVFRDPKLVSRDNGVVGQYFRDLGSFQFFSSKLGNYPKLSLRSNEGLYFRYIDGKGWEWAFWEGFYKSVNYQTQDPIRDAKSISRGAFLDTKEKKILDALKNKDLAQGATILYGSLIPDDVISGDANCNAKGGACMPSANCAPENKKLGNLCGDSNEICCLVPEKNECRNAYNGECKPSADCPSLLQVPSVTDCNADGMVCCMPMPTIGDCLSKGGVCVLNSTFCPADKPLIDYTSDDCVIQSSKCCLPMKVQVVCPSNLNTPGDTGTCIVTSQPLDSLDSDNDILCDISALEDQGTCETPEGEIILVEVDLDMQGDESVGTPIPVTIVSTSSNDARYIGTSCGNGGTCISISAGTVCQGTIRDNLCLGSNDIKCCEPNTQISGDLKLVCPYVAPFGITADELSWTITDCDVKEPTNIDKRDKIICNVPSGNTYDKVSCLYLNSNTEMWCNLLGRENNNKANCYFPGDYELTDYPGKDSINTLNTNSDIRIRFLEQLEESEGTIVSGTSFLTYKDYNGNVQHPNDHCSNAVYGVMGLANLGLSSVYYSAAPGESYTFNYRGTQYTKAVNSAGTCVGAASGGTLGSNVYYEDFLDTLVPGDLIDVFFSNTQCHGVVFIGWENRQNYEARIFDWNGQSISQFSIDEGGVMCDEDDFYSGTLCKTYQYTEYYVGLNPGSRDYTHPIYKSWYPVNSSVYRLS